MPYYEKLMKRAAKLDRGGVYGATIKHDADCPFLAGTGPCTCDAIVEIKRMNRAQRRAKSRRRS